MAKLGSSSCGPLLQGMLLLLALLLLPSIQAGGQGLAGLVEKAAPVVNKGKELFVEPVVEKFRDKAINKGLTKWGENNPGRKDFIDGLKKGLKFRKYLCKAQRRVDKLNPGGASGTPYFTVEFLGGGLLSNSFPTFSYSVTGNSVVPFCRSADQSQVQAAGTTLFPPTTMMYVRITGIRVAGVGQEDVPVQPPAYTYDLQSSLDGRLRDAVDRQVKALNRRAKPPINTNDKLCYAAAASLPRIAILLTSVNSGGGVMTMELSGGATDTIWHQESFLFCLGIRRTVELLISLDRP